MATVTLPKEWALHMTHMASEFVHAQFKNFLAGGPLLKPPQNFQAEISLACIELARALSDAHSNPIKLEVDIIRYNEALRRNELGTNPGCINISPCWFQQGREVIGDPRVQTFMPELSANLKGDHRREIMVSTQRLGLLASAALRVMHPELYFAGLHMILRLGEWAEKQGNVELLDCLKNWASVFNVATVMCNRLTPPHRDPKCPPEDLDIMMSVSEYTPVVMDLMNLGITSLGQWWRHAARL
ncbi:hypothetical protein AZE42_12191 [Rhizopogon vesiculosus]|uniref:Uncharacterized protein n=1 Tax=Rhizopogon vesiculosus TaxID=180088 RepID=A0A1J8QNR1_9AGAM|nr:hypothetical protein AZE42_12191 [Rhizopogon vesiculosus]